MTRQPSIGKLKTGITAYRMPLGEVPGKLVQAKRWSLVLRRALEDEVQAAHGGVSLTQAAKVDTAATAQLASGIIMWCLRNKMDTLSGDQISSMCDRLVTLKERRDRAIASLNLDADKSSQILALYSPSLPGLTDASQTHAPSPPTSDPPATASAREPSDTATTEHTPATSAGDDDDCFPRSVFER